MIFLKIYGQIFTIITKLIPPKLKINIDGKFAYYKTIENFVCIISPCTHFDLNKNYLSKLSMVTSFLFKIIVIYYLIYINKIPYKYIIIEL